MAGCECWLAACMVHSLAERRSPTRQTGILDSESSLSTVTSVARHSGSLTNRQTTWAEPMRLTGVFYHLILRVRKPRLQELCKFLES